LSCPDCHGAMYEIRDDELIRYRCHTGHAFTADALDAAQAETWERALYDALRVQEEQATLARSMADGARKQGRYAHADDLERRKLSYEEGAELIRQLLARANGAGNDLEGLANVSG
jgi:two-component system, chemotaxis family, protein-glutamate methylesterase/glutaminase